MAKPIYLIVAMARNGAIGKDRKLPWRIPSEWDYFLKTTEGGVMVMGRICAEEFGQALPGRAMIAISAQPELNLPGMAHARSLPSAIELAQESSYDGPIWICGGTRIYEESFPLASRLYLSLIDADYAADTFFPEGWETYFPKKLSGEPHTDGGVHYEICVYGK